MLCSSLQGWIHGVPRRAATRHRHKRQVRQSHQDRSQVHQRTIEPVTTPPIIVIHLTAKHDDPLTNSRFQLLQAGDLLERLHL